MAKPWGRQTALRSYAKWITGTLLSQRLRDYIRQCHMIGKEALMDNVLPDGTTVRKGWRVIFSSFCIGKVESLWGKNCLEYLPERWLDENGALELENRYWFPVFHAEDVSWERSGLYSNEINCSVCV